MENFLALIMVLTFGWLIFGLINPQKAAPFLNAPGRLPIIGIFLVAQLAIGAMGAATFDNSKPASVKKAPPQITEEQKVNSEKEKKDANDAIIAKLGDFYKETDEVEKKEWYIPYKDNIPAKTAVYWYVGLNSENKINQRIKLVHFSDDINWVFWDKVIFSTSNKNWEYEIGSFVGQSGGGKSTEIVMGGKYEVLDVPVSKVLEGFELVTTGENPIIRLQGDERKYDIRLSAADLENLRGAVAFAKKANLIGGKINR